ncbi:unnamed protein product [Pieris macdunnoughi]|uniref:Endonuclease/exonuclease/phosphatase domain-containing protein n=1 Tax=Pieris macdunnoughi TaxID=345717 RepID=A0A821UFP5_9NEOP|nr:unnamed protein product [Pieris macdunnoughi]
MDKNVVMLWEKLEEKLNQQTLTITSAVTTNVMEAINNKMDSIIQENKKLKTQITKLKQKLDQMEIDKRKCLPSGIYVKEDYSKHIIETRKQLQPKVEEERNKGNFAYIKYDKLIVKKPNDPGREKRKREQSDSPISPTQKRGIKKQLTTPDNRNKNNANCRSTPTKDNERKHALTTPSRLVTVGLSDYYPPNSQFLTNTINSNRSHSPHHISPATEISHIFICTFNARSLSSDEKLLEFKESIASIRYDIIGLSEIRREGYNIEEYSEHIFCYFGERKGHLGVGFLLKKILKQYIESFIGVSERICILNLKIINLDMSIIQVHAPTSEASDNEIEKFYEQVRNAMKHCNKQFILAGDFNARIGKRLPGEERVMGANCFGKRDQRGDLLLQFCRENDLKIINTQFTKKLKNLWTWLSPKKRRSQIDYILTNDMRHIQNIEVVHNLSFASDHSLVRCTYIVKDLKRVG